MTEARVFNLAMEGGAMGGLAGATLDGVERSPRELAAAGKVWAFNGRADMPDAPEIEARRGETIAIRIENRTAWPHAMHLHGHHFRVVENDGGYGPLRDTHLMAPRETATIAFLADNPGDWVFHCHVIEHQKSGLTGYVKVI